ncbi:MAG: hypothetical protein ABSF53_19110 [Terracidiphilus sp.]
MNNALGGRSWQLLIFMMLLTGSAIGQSTGVLYPGWGTTLNGNAVYFSVLLREASQVQTFAESSTITFGGAELDLAPNSTLVIGDPFVLSCGTILVRAGAAEISNGEKSASFAVGESVHSDTPQCSDPPPDAPSAVRSDQPTESNRWSKHKSSVAPAAAVGGLYFDANVANWRFVTVNGVMFGSSVAAAELTQRCLLSGACTDVPNAFHSRAAMYGAGLPAEAGVAYLGYYLKSKGYPWWFAPAIVVTVGDIVVSTHAAHYSH